MNANRYQLRHSRKSAQPLTWSTNKNIFITICFFVFGFFFAFVFWVFLLFLSNTGWGIRRRKQRRFCLTFCFFYFYYFSDIYFLSTKNLFYIPLPLWSVGLFPCLPICVVDSCSGWFLFSVSTFIFTLPCSQPFTSNPVTFRQPEAQPRVHCIGNVLWKRIEQSLYTII